MTTQQTVNLIISEAAKAKVPHSASLPFEGFKRLAKAAGVDFKTFSEELFVYQQVLNSLLSKQLNV